jgi:hypothetical protein
VAGNEIQFVSRPFTMRELQLGQIVANQKNQFTTYEVINAMIELLHLRTDKEVPKERFADMEQAEFYVTMDRCVETIKPAVALGEFEIQMAQGRFKKP